MNIVAQHLSKMLDLAGEQICLRMHGKADSYFRYADIKWFNKCYFAFITVLHWPYGALNFSDAPLYVLKKVSGMMSQTRNEVKSAAYFVSFFSCSLQFIIICLTLFKIGPIND